jgi:GR25 family glycosyltransferase involved in LPS biosynthesis
VKYLLAILLMVQISSYEDFLKTCSNKLKNCNCDFVDYVYVINLDQRPEKYELVENQLNSCGVQPYRFSAVNGWELPANMITKAGVEYKSGFKKGIKSTVYIQDENGKLSSEFRIIESPGVYLSHCMSRGAIGIVLSHLSIIKDAYESGYKRVWIMEDDIEILEDINKIKGLIENANALYSKKWDVIYTDTDTISNGGDRIPCYAIADRPDVPLSDKMVSKLLKRKTVSKLLTRLGNRYGAYSYILNRGGMKKILNFYKEHRIFLPFDMEFIYIDNFLQLSSRREIVSHRINSQSDNGGPNYLNK